MDRPLFIVFEGIDGSGKGTQIHKLMSHIDFLSKYHDTMKTHEPWKDSEIKRRLKEEYAEQGSALELAKLFIGDRKRHLDELIFPALKQGVFVVCDRYAMSTCAYQATQGADMTALVDLHRIAKISAPDITFLLDVAPEVARERISKRKEELEKFEKCSPEFRKRLIDNYLLLADRANSEYNDVLGKVFYINGNNCQSKVFEEIKFAFDGIYFNR